MWFLFCHCASLCWRTNARKFYESFWFPRDSDMCCFLANYTKCPWLHERWLTVVYRQSIIYFLLLPPLFIKFQHVQLAANFSWNLCRNVFCFHHFIHVSTLKFQMLNNFGIWKHFSETYDLNCLYWNSTRYANLFWWIIMEHQHYNLA